MVPNTTATNTIPEQLRSQYPTAFGVFWDALFALLYLNNVKVPRFRSCRI